MIIIHLHPKPRYVYKTSKHNALQINSVFIRNLMKKHGTIVMAHRGGNWSADNSIANFKAAVENRVEGVETDVWLTKDGVPMIVHGGDDGQLALYGLPEEYVYDWTCEELKTKLKLPNGEEMPTLLEMLFIFQGSDILLNIELKGPLSADRKSLYNF